MEALYCPHCNMKLVGKDIEGKELYCCTNCGMIFMKISDSKFKYLGQTSGNNSMRELFDIIDNK